MSTSKEQEDEERKNRKIKSRNREKYGNDWYGFGIQIIKNLIYTLLFGLMGANFIFYYKVLNFETDEDNNEDNNEEKKEDNYFPVKTSFYNNDFGKDMSVSIAKEKEEEDEANGENGEEDSDEMYRGWAAELDMEEAERQRLEDNEGDESNADQSQVSDKNKEKKQPEVKEEEANESQLKKKEKDVVDEEEKKEPSVNNLNQENDDQKILNEIEKELKPQIPTKIKLQSKIKDLQNLQNNVTVLGKKIVNLQDPRNLMPKDQKEEQLKELNSKRDSAREQLVKAQTELKQLSELSLKRKSGGGEKEYKCGKDEIPTEDDKPSKESKADFPYNLFNYKELEDCGENTCDIPFSSWWKNMFSYSIYNTNKVIRKYTRSWFNSDGNKKYSILESDTSFYLMSVFYFIAGLIFSCFSGVIYLATTLLLDKNKATTKQGFFMDWTPTLWIIFNFLLFGLVFGIMSIFTIVTIIQYIVNFTIKPLMNDPDDIKNILKCNVHTLILFFCLLTIYTSSEYLDDTSTIVMSVVTVLYFIRTVIIYFQG
jgi:hypothetical protein